MGFPKEDLTEMEKEMLDGRGYKFLCRLQNGGRVFLFEYTRPPKDFGEGGEDGYEDEGESGERPKRNLAGRILQTKRTPLDLKDHLPREISLLTDLRHPDIVTLHSVLQWNATKYMVFTRYAEFGSLSDFLMLHGWLKESEARRWTRQVGAALHFLHDSLRIVHRSVKPENVLITGNRNAKLGHFRLARSVAGPEDDGRYDDWSYDGFGDEDEEEEEDFLMMNRGPRDPVFCETFCGSLGYAAPELLKGELYEGEPVDMWALGVLVYTMLNDALPFDTSNLLKLSSAQMNKEYRFRNRARMRVSDEAVELVDRLLEPEPVSRFTAEEALRSAWMRMDPNTSKLTRPEIEAIKRVRREKRLRRAKFREICGEEGEWANEVEPPPEPDDQDEPQPETKEEDLPPAEGETQE